MDLTAHQRYEHPQHVAAKDFAVHVHNEWGVGEETPEGGSGVLIFMSELDRTIFISRGDALANVLTDGRLQHAIENMKPFLRLGNFTGALVNVIGEIDFLVEKGPPRGWERIGEWWHEFGTFIAIVVFLLGTAFSIVRDDRRKREYAKVASQLSEIDEARARALQGQYEANSCPICLESFPPQTEGDVDRLGSDGKPLKLLRCGHVFDSDCWDEWVRNGRGQIRKCPICKEDVGVSISDRDTNEGRAPPSQTEHLVRRAVSNEDRGSSTSSESEQSRQDRDLERYNRERIFRLNRLSLRYPRVLESQTIQRWSSRNHHGSLARDPDFVRRNPATTNNRDGGSSSSSRSDTYRGGGGSSFSGGSCRGGGRGGGW